MNVIAGSSGCKTGRTKILRRSAHVRIEFGLDLGGREDLVRRLSTLARDTKAPMMVLVTHHVEEVPDGFTHAMLLRCGSVLAAGPIAEVFTERNLSKCFGVPLQVEYRHARWAARAVQP